MTNKKTLIKNYKKAQQEFSKIMVPIKTTPPTIASELTDTYNNYVEWFKEVEAYAEKEGWFNELIR